MFILYKRIPPKYFGQNDTLNNMILHCVQFMYTDRLRNKNGSFIYMM